jgi:hypothetical protein
MQTMLPTNPASVANPRQYYRMPRAPVRQSVRQRRDCGRCVGTWKLEAVCCRNLGTTIAEPRQRRPRKVRSSVVAQRPVRTVGVGTPPPRFLVGCPPSFSFSSATDPPSRPSLLSASFSAVCGARSGGVWECHGKSGFASHDTTTPMDRFMQLTKNRGGPRTWLSRANNRRVAQLETPTGPKETSESDISRTPQRAFCEASMQPRTGIFNHTPLVSSPQSALAQGTPAGHRPVSVMALTFARVGNRGEGQADLPAKTNGLA